MIGSNKVLVQVCISKNALSYIQQYKKLFGVSVSHFCEIAIYDKILMHGVNLDDKQRKE